MPSFLNLPPPDRSIMMQSPPPSDPNFEQVEDAPYKGQQVDPKGQGKVVFKSKCLKVPTIIILESEES